uniref:CCHC-type domain-containing protein n=1 Tax=Strongyloides venezuelensis TaxID=75913 RepID=A0A0K0FW67_STRVS
MTAEVERNYIIVYTILKTLASHCLRFVDLPEGARIRKLREIVNEIDSVTPTQNITESTETETNTNDINTSIHKEDHTVIMSPPTVISTNSWISLPQFNEQVEGISQYLNRMELLFTFDGIVDEKKKCAAILSKMPSSVLHDFERLSVAEQNRYSNLSELKAFLQQTFGTHMNIKNAFMKLRSWRLREDERYIHDDLMELVELVRLTSNGPHTEVISRAKQYIQDRIRSEKVFDKLLLTDYESLSELVSDVETTYSLYHKRARNKRNNVNMHTLKSKSIQCYYCGKLGHKEAVCRSKISGRPRIQTRSQVQSTCNSNNTPTLKNLSSNRIETVKVNKDPYLQFLDDEINRYKNVVESDNKILCIRKVSHEQNNDKVELMSPRDYRLIAYLEDNMPIVCVADSGSHISLIRENRAKINGFDRSTNEKFNAKCANSTPLPLKGKIRINISLAKDLTLSFPFAVVSDDQFPDALSSILLG